MYSGSVWIALLTCAVLISASPLSGEPAPSSPSAVQMPTPAPDIDGHSDDWACLPVESDAMNCHVDPEPPALTSTNLHHTGHEDHAVHIVGHSDNWAYSFVDSDAMDCDINLDPPALTSANLHHPGHEDPTVHLCAASWHDDEVVEVEPAFDYQVNTFESWPDELEVYGPGRLYHPELPGDYDARFISQDVVWEEWVHLDQWPTFENASLRVDTTGNLMQVAAAATESENAAAFSSLHFNAGLDADMLDSFNAREGIAIEPGRPPVCESGSIRLAPADTEQFEDLQFFLPTPSIQGHGPVGQSPHDDGSERIGNGRYGDDDRHIVREREDEAERLAPHGIQGNHLVVVFQVRPRNKLGTERPTAASKDDNGKMFVCPKCSRSFSKAPSLSKHTANEGCAKHTCRWCGFTSPYHNTVKNHEQACKCGPRDKPYACTAPACKWRFSRREHLKRHVEKVHGPVAKNPLPQGLYSSVQTAAKGTHAARVGDVQLQSTGSQPSEVSTEDQTIVDSTEEDSKTARDKRRLRDSSEAAGWITETMCGLKFGSYPGSPGGSWQRFPNDAPQLLRYGPDSQYEDQDNGEGPSGQTGQSSSHQPHQTREEPGCSSRRHSTYSRRATLPQRRNRGPTSRHRSRPNGQNHPRTSEEVLPPSETPNDSNESDDDDDIDSFDTQPP